MNVPLLDLRAQYVTIANEVEPELLRIARTQMCILGADVELLEKNLAEYLKVKHTIAVSSGSDAILMALMALGIGPNDEVILPTFSFFATAGCVARLFAKPIFIDSEPHSFNINPDLIESKINSKTKAIMPVHLFGQSANMDVISSVSKKYNIPVIEDAAQALGTQYKDGRFVGTIGELGCYSFYPSKNLGAFGDGGLIATNNDDLAIKLKQMRNHGMNPKYYHKFIGGNFRLDAIQAVVLNIKLKYLENWHRGRQKNAKLYRKYFEKYNLLDKVIVPLELYAESGTPNHHIYNQFTIQVPKRNELRDFLLQNSIGCDIYYPVPFHRQECFSYLNCNDNDYPVANQFADTVLSLPVYPELSEEQIEYVVQTIKKFYDNN